jgi:cell division protein FtsB
MPEELHELQEHAEEGRHDPSIAPVTVTMAILAVLVAAVSLLGHRAHTEVVLLQTKASNQWAYYQAKNIRQHSYEVFLDELSVFSAKDPAQADKIREKYAKELERYRDEQKEIEAEARKLENERDTEHRRANRLDLGEVLLEAALVITSITLLTRKKFFWGFGVLLGVIGLVIAATGFLVQ